MDEPLCTSIPAAVKLSGVGRSSLYKEIKQGNLKIIKIGTRTLIRMSDLRAWLDAKSEG